VIFTGFQDDGVAGLAEVKRRGGVAVVEDPSTALFPSMPCNAVKHVQAEAPIQQIAGIISNLAVTERNTEIAQEPMERSLTEIRCPECAGPLWEERQGSIVEYRCKVGHAYSLLSLREEHQELVERSLWEAILTLESAAEVASMLGPEGSQDARDKRAQAEVLRTMLTGTLPREE